MRKKILNEREGTLIIVDIIFYILTVIIGYLLVDYENYNIQDTLMFLPGIFYTLAFLSCIAYFANRKRDYYEFLMYCLINVLTGTFILVNKYNPSNTFILGDALLFYSVSCIANKIYLVNRLWKVKDINFIPKLTNSVLLAFISAFAVYTLYNKEEMAYMIIGYYIMGYGLISLLEPFTYIVLGNPTIDRLLVSFLKYNTEETKQSNNTRKVNTRKINKIKAKERQGSLVKKEENIKNNNKKKK